MNFLIIPEYFQKGVPLNLREVIDKLVLVVDELIALVADILFVVKILQLYAPFMDNVLTSLTNHPLDTIVILLALQTLLQIIVQFPLELRLR